MAELTAPGEDGAPAASRWRVPPWLRIVLVYLAARVVTTLFLQLAAQLSTPWHSWQSRASNWPRWGSRTAEWQAAQSGVPRRMRRDPSGVR